MTAHITTAAAALAAAAAFAVPAAAQAPGTGNTTTLTFKESDKGATFSFLDNPPRARSRRHPTVSAGDEFIFTSSLVSDSGARLGELRAVCTITRPSKNPDRAPSVCTGAFVFRTGTLFALVSQSSNNAPTTRGAIVGGTGAYANARGSFVSHSTKTGGNDTVTLVG